MPSTARLLGDLERGRARLAVAERDLAVAFRDFCAVFPAPGRSRSRSRSRSSARTPPPCASLPPPSPTSPALSPTSEAWPFSPGWTTVVESTTPPPLDGPEEFKVGEQLWLEMVVVESPGGGPRRGWIVHRTP